MLFINRDRQFLKMKDCFDLELLNCTEYHYTVTVLQHHLCIPQSIRCDIGTVMRIIKLKIFPVPVRLHSGYGKLIFVIISPIVQYLRTLYIVWSLVRRRVTRRLTRFQTMHNVLKNSKTL